jgi:hypothetical protein
MVIQQLCFFIENATNGLVTYNINNMWPWLPKHRTGSKLHLTKLFFEAMQECHSYLFLGVNIISAGAAK